MEIRFDRSFKGLSKMKIKHSGIFATWGRFRAKYLYLGSAQPLSERDITSWN